MMVNVIIIVVDGVLAIEVVSGRTAVAASVVHLSVMRQQCLTKFIMAVDEGFAMCPGYGCYGFVNTWAGAERW